MTHSKPLRDFSAAKQGCLGGRTFEGSVSRDSPGLSVADEGHGALIPRHTR